VSNDLVSLLRALAITSNLVIALGYVMLGFLVSTKFDAAGPTWALFGFKVAGLTFFIMCAVTHLHEASHIYDELLPIAYWSTWHYQAHMALQAVAAIVASGLGLGFISLRIFDKRYYAGLLDRVIDEQAQELSVLARRADVERAAAEAQAVAEAAEIVLKAMRGG
jgi:hypothetical protein